jgi:N-acetylglucosaminyl-diphospho-decaprenol L-rhamnosyltransferase
MTTYKLERITVSIVSHGHHDLIVTFAKQLALVEPNALIHLIITINEMLLEDFDQSSIARNSFSEVTLLKNSRPKGFGANHNQAFKHCKTDLFCVVNPDIDLLLDPFPSLANAFSNLSVGLTYPSQINANKASLDFERNLVSPTSIIQRHLLRRSGSTDQSKSVHWVSGAFMVFKSSVFRELNGFDERYFMYCEDVDICLRLQLAGYTLARADTTVIHHTQRQTLKNPQHLAWHIRSLFRLWNSDAYKAYKRQFIDGRA